MIKYEKVIETAKAMNAKIFVLVEGDYNDADYISKYKTYEVEKFTEEVYKALNILLTEFGGSDEISTKLLDEDEEEFYREKYPELWDSRVIADLIPYGEWGPIHSLSTIKILFELKED